ncbi:MAG: hypothetical protein L6V93_19005 [Clostridiales bacterium]|nr:MAG: hypothetical protein L6V93_19005 [Clostridiales bacterium]
MGGGCCSDSASAEINKFIKSTKIPVVSTLKAVGVVRHDTGALNLGMIGTHGRKCANFALSACDTLFIAGARIGDRSVGRVKNLNEEDITVIHVDIDPAEIGKKICTQTFPSWAILQTLCRRLTTKKHLPFARKRLAFAP